MKTLSFNATEFHEFTPEYPGTYVIIVGSNYSSDFGTGNLDVKQDEVPLVDELTGNALTNLNGTGRYQCYLSGGTPVIFNLESATNPDLEVVVILKSRVVR